MSERVGMIGLGEMGLPMARNLGRRGFEVLGFDVSEGARERARAEGVVLRPSVREVARDVTRAVISIVRDRAQTEAVLFGEDGVAAAGRSGLAVVVMSTLSPGILQALGLRAAQAGLALLDAPVSGARAGAEAGTLTVMVSGARDAHQACLPYFQAMGTHVFHLGDRPGAGQAAKLTNNLMLAAAMVGCAEGLRFGKRHGIAEERLLELLRVSTADGWVVQHWEEVRRWWTEYRPGATLDVVEKDLRAIVGDCQEAGAVPPMTAECLAALKDAWERPA